MLGYKFELERCSVYGIKALNNIKSVIFSFLEIVCNKCFVNDFIIFNFFL